jgi:hypothetical protein
MCIYNMSHYKLHLSSYNELVYLFIHVHTYGFISLRQYKDPYFVDEVFVFSYTVLIYSFKLNLLFFTLIFEWPYLENFVIILLSGQVETYLTRLSTWHGHMIEVNGIK